MQRLKSSGRWLIVLCEEIGLLVIGLATLVAMGVEIGAMWQAKSVALSDLLLLFIYLEVFAMVGIYLKSGKLPVRMPLYITIVALARYMILDMKNLDIYQILGISGAVLLLAVAILILRFGHYKFPYGNEDSS